MNNRQNGRRRGRGGVRPQNGAPRPDGGNRIDNRARGNAAQLYEKYKSLARDAQMQGDRVLTEYYFQFADHYFRVLAETRPREDGQPQNARRFRDDDRFDPRDDFQEGFEGNEGYPDERVNGGRTAPDGNRVPPAEPPQESFAAPQSPPISGAVEPEPVDEAPRRRRGRPPRRDEGAAREAESGERIDIASLPPAVRAEPAAPSEPSDDEATGDGDGIPRRRRTRRPRGPAEAIAEV